MIEHAGDAEERGAGLIDQETRTARFGDIDGDLADLLEEDIAEVLDALLKRTLRIDAEVLHLVLFELDLFKLRLRTLLGPGLGRLGESGIFGVLGENLVFLNKVIALRVKPLELFLRALLIGKELSVLLLGLVVGIVNSGQIDHENTNSLSRSAAGGKAEHAQGKEKTERVFHRQIYRREETDKSESGAKRKIKLIPFIILIVGREGDAEIKAQGRAGY